MDTKKASPVKGEQQFMRGPKPYKGKGPSKPTEKKPVTMNQKIAEVDKKIEAKAKQADRTDSPTMQKPFDKVPKPIKTVDRIVESPDGKGYQLLPEEEKKKLDTAKKFEQLGLLAFSNKEDDELSLETITSNKSKGLNKSQVSQKSTTKPKVEQPNNVMPRTATKKVKEGEKTPFHQNAFEVAGGVESLKLKGSNVGGWIMQEPRRQQSFCTQLTSPKGIANLMRLRNPTPPQTDSDSGSSGSNKSNRFAVLQEEDDEEDSDATTDVVPIDGIAEATQEGAVLIQADSNKVPDNIQVQVAKPEVEGGIVPQENDPQPDGVVSSKGADFHKAESE